MKQLIVICLCLIGSTNAFAQNCNCDSTFKIVAYHIENNYAGWFDKNKQFVQQDFAQMTNTVANNCKTITIDSICYKEIKKYVTYFKDHHLHVDYYPITKKVAAKESADPITIESNSMTELGIMNYLKTNKQLDKAEGIWVNETYRIGVIKSKTKNNWFEGVILDSKNDNWKVNEIKLYIKKAANNTYKLQFITGDKTELVENNAVFFKNILDAQNMILGKVFPKISDTISIDDYTLENDPGNPKLQFPKADLAVWTFPNFYPQNDEVVTTLLNKYKSKLATTKYWVIDLRFRFSNTPFIIT